MNSQTIEIPNPGKFDPEFGTNGGLIYLKHPSRPLQGISGRGLDTDTNGNAYIVGNIENDSFRNEYFCVRLTTKGEIDKTFGNEGYVSGHFGSDSEAAESIATEVRILRDQKILVIGQYQILGTGKLSKALVRLLPDGSLDLDFGIKGKIILDLGDRSLHKGPVPDDSGTTSNDLHASNSTTIILDEKILLVGQFYREVGVVESLLIRLMPNGMLDTSFNEKGFVIIAHPDFTGTTALDSLLITESGKFVLSGTVGLLNDREPLITQLHDTGELDTSFASNGYLVIESPPERNFRIMSLVRQTNRRILAVGYAGFYAPDGLLISREPDGTENIQFNGGKPVLENLGGLGLTAWGTASIILSNGKILVLGSVKHPVYSHTTTALVRFTGAGSLDLTYGNGTGWYSFGHARQTRGAVAFMPGKVLFLGMDVIDGNEFNYIARALIE